MARCIEIKGVPHLSLTLRSLTRDTTKNLPTAEGVEWVRQRIGREFCNALLSTTKNDWQLFVPENGKARLVTHKPSVTEAPLRTHDKTKSTYLDASAGDWLRGLGIEDERGRVNPSMADKHRQIARYLEIVSHLAKECGWDGSGPDASQAAGPVLADMGCGKGYLTFGVWHLFRRVWNRPVEMIGVEARADLVAQTNALAQRIGADGLRFEQGTIQSVQLPKLDGLIALHACNTATDDAILRGVAAQAKLIVVAPCCHQEVRPQLGHPEPLAPILKHGLMEERLAEWLTDGLRALYLEWAGYRTKVIEFVSSEHTPKNLMLAAVRVREPFSMPAQRERIIELQTFFGIRHHALDCLLKQPEPVAMVEEKS